MAKSIRFDQCLMLARPTVNQALTRLLKLKRIEQIGRGRGTRYRKS